MVNMHDVSAFENQKQKKPPKWRLFYLRGVPRFSGFAYLAVRLNCGP